MYLRLERKASPFIAWSVEREASLYCMPSCIRSEVRLHLINRFCVVIFVRKGIMATPGSLLVFCTAQKQDNFGAYNQSYTFA